MGLTKVLVSSTFSEVDFGTSVVEGGVGDGSEGAEISGSLTTVVGSDAEDDDSSSMVGVIVGTSSLSKLAPVVISNESPVSRSDIIKS